MKNLSRLLAGLSLVWYLSVTEARADPIGIQSGSLDLRIQTGDCDICGTIFSLAGPLVLEGNRGFSLGTNLFAGDGLLALVATCGLFPCTSGMNIGLHSSWSIPPNRPIRSPITATLDGVSYPPESDTGALLDFRGSVLAPTLVSDEPHVVTAPFSFRGSFRHGNLTEVLTGGGQASVFFFLPFERPSGKEVAVGRVLFEFTDPAPVVPEPGSLLLMGTGLTALAYRFRRGGSRTTPKQTD